MLSKFHIRDDAKSARIALKGLSDRLDCTSPYLRFDIDADGVPSQFHEPRRVPSFALAMESPRIGCAILEKLIPTDGVITRDPTHRAIVPDMSGVFGNCGISKSIRRLAYERLQTNALAIEVTSNQEKSSFTQELATPASWPCHIGLDSFPYVWHPDIVVLQFEHPTSSRLEDVSFDATSLLRMTEWFAPCTEMRLEVFSTSSSSDSVNQQHKITLEDLRLSLDTFSEGIARESPDRSHERCPSVWMNARGEVREADHDSETAYMTRYTDRKVRLFAFKDTPE